MIQKYLCAITGLKKQRKEASLHYPLKKRERESPEALFSGWWNKHLQSLPVQKKKTTGAKILEMKAKGRESAHNGNGTYSLLTDTITCLRQLCCPVVKNTKTNTVSKSSHSRLIHSENWNFILNSLKVHNPNICSNYPFIFKYSFFIILKNSAQNVFHIFCLTIRNIIYI